MFDTNNFKRSVKEWVRNNPDGPKDDLIDYCEGLIPPNLFNNYQWLIDQTSGWYDHVIQTRRSNRSHELESDDIA